ncbi:MAG TPA: AraC family transcriptional regulator ligand-binding domain-containing protein [Terriglobales bacterium]|nr:AraC family transcriptional regulator ligand-binding domain-containing protein [Terriglobales bacterium]
MSTSLLARWVNFEVDALEAVGFPAIAHFRANGYPINREPGWARQPWFVLASGWKAAEKHTQDPALGLHAGLRASLAEPGFIAYSMLCAANLRETFAFFAEFQELCIDAHILSLEQRGDRDAICLHPAIEPAPSKHHAEFLFVLFVRAGRHILGERFAPAAIHLRRTVPPLTREYTAAFGCPVYWDQARDEMLVESKWMLQPSPYSHPETVRMLRERAAAFRQQYTAPNWSARVKALVERMMRDGESSIAMVAKNLGVSPRTLQRRLTEEGVRFEEVRDGARRALALELLGRDQVRIAEVAQQLGFSDARAFRRAFQRWTGMAPVEVGPGAIAKKRRKGR